jgi:ketosteroid isomerase-like protein
MRNITRTLQLIIFCLSAMSIQIFAQDIDEMKKNIEEWNKQFSEAMINHDNEKMLAFYADDVMSLPSYQPMMEGIETIKNAMMMDENSGNKYTKFQLTSKKVLLQGNLLVDIGTYDLAMDIVGMEAPYNDQGKYVTIYEKQDDGNWKIKVETWNSDNNPWMSNDNMDDNQDEMK